MRQSVIDLCEDLARSRLLVQGAGGNVSWKDGDVLWIKASGSRLADARQQPIFIPVSLSSLRLARDTGDFSADPAVLNDSPLRPSIETSLHALLPQRVVVHLHAVEILAHLVRLDARELLRARLPANIAWVLIDYKKPGADLAKALALALAQAPSTQVVFLGNHGVVICADSTNEIDQILGQLTAAMATVPRPHVKLPAPNALSGIRWFGPYQRIPDDDAQQLALDASLFDHLAHAWALYPEQVVFLGASAACFEYHASVPFGLTGAVFVRGVGVFASTKFSADQMAQLRCYYDVMTRQPLSALFRVLSDDEVTELVNWDAEKYRLQRANLLNSVT